MYQCVVGSSYGYALVEGANVLSPMRLAPQVPLALGGDGGTSTVEIEPFAQTFATACLDWLFGKTWPDDAFLSLRVTMLGTSATSSSNFPRCAYRSRPSRTPDDPMFFTPSWTHHHGPAAVHP